MKSSWFTYFPVAVNESVIAVRLRLPKDLQAKLLADTPMLRESIAVDALDFAVIESLDALLGVGKNGKFFRRLSIEVDSGERAKHPVLQVSIPSADYRELLDSAFEVNACSICGFGRYKYRSIKLKKEPKSPIVLLDQFPSWNVEFLFASSAAEKASKSGITGLSFSALSANWALATITKSAWSKSMDVLAATSVCAEHNAVRAMVPRGEVWQVSDFTSDFCVLQGTMCRDNRIAGLPPGWCVSQRGYDFLSAEAKLRIATVRLNETFRPLLLEPSIF